MGDELVSYEFKAVPVFRILDFQTAYEFYTQFLGFNLDWTYRFEPSSPVYMQVSKRGLIIHLTENIRFNTETIVFIETKGLSDFHNELRGKNSLIQLQDISKTKWKTFQLEVVDPFGNILRFNEAVNNIE